ncbi:MAG: putative nuclease of the RNAse fold, HicB family [Verrucomicrobiales bacterium]|nr:putative nuclease of the RNAse fold, HicB family [Verrucomicrobiales bacterium]
MMRLEQIDHVALRCASLEASKDWYVSTLGFEHVYPGYGNGVPVVLRLGSTFLTLFPQKSNEVPAPNGRAWHLALRATTYNDFKEAQRELQARGVSFQFQDHEISHSIYFSDPDGFLLEITTYDIHHRGIEEVSASLARVSVVWHSLCMRKTPKREFSVVVERDEEGYYVASVPALPGCHTQARSLDKLIERIKEAIQLCLEAEDDVRVNTEFVGVQRVTV